MRNIDLKQAIVVFICFIATTGSLSAQSKVIDLWNEKVPGSIVNKGYKQLVNSANWIKLRFVTNPSLQVYPVPDINITDH